MNLPVCSVLSGSDGLVKLWTIKTNECVKTLDAHQDKVWGLHSSRKDDRMVTGSADSHITVWTVSSTQLSHRGCATRLQDTSISCLALVYL